MSASFSLLGEEGRGWRGKDGGGEEGRGRGGRRGGQGEGRAGREKGGGGEGRGRGGRKEKERRGEREGSRLICGCRFEDCELFNCGRGAVSLVFFVFLLGVEGSFVGVRSLRGMGLLSWKLR